MSLAFSNTTSKNGIIQGIERTLFGDNGDGRISGNTTLLAYFTGDVNLALDKAFSIIFNAEGRWQFDDSNHTDYPVITTDLIANQRDYSFTTDNSSNLILHIHKVLIANDAGVYSEATPKDVQQDSDTESFWDGQNTTGTPYRYDMTSNAIFLDPIPSYNETNGLKVYISREASYFTTADTTKKPGIAGIFHEYLVLRPSWMYAQRNNFANAGALFAEVTRMEEEITKYYSKRDRHERKVMTNKKILYV